MLITNTWNSDEGEIILINDGSTDNSLKIIKKLRENDQRIKILEAAKIYDPTTSIEDQFDNLEIKFLLKA